MLMRMPLIPPQYKVLAIGLVLALLTSWALLERTGKLSAKNKVEDLEGQLDLAYAHIEEQNRAVKALDVASAAARARLAQLELERQRSNGPLVATVQRLEAALASKEAFSKGCGDALREAREGK